MKDYYKILGVPATASKEQIRQMYRSKAKLLHPDLNQNNPEAAEKLIKINDAYDTLGDETKRKVYDQQVAQFRAQLRAQQAPPPPSYPPPHMYQNTQQVVRPMYNPQFNVDQLTANAYHQGYTKGYGDASIKQKESERTMAVQIQTFEELLRAAQEERGRTEINMRTLELRLRETQENMHKAISEKDAVLALFDEQMQAIGKADSCDNEKLAALNRQISELTRQLGAAQDKAKDLQARCEAGEAIVFADELEVNRLKEENRTLEDKIASLEQYVAARATSDSHDELVVKREQKIKDIKKRIKNTHYGMMGILFWADKTEIQKAYEKLKARYVFKKSKGDAKSGEKLKELDDALATLLDDAKRKAYNASVGISEREVKEELKTAREFANQEKKLLEQKAEDSFWAQVEDLTFLAQTGDADAQNHLGEMYYFGDEIEQDLAQAFYWFQEAAKLSHPYALFNLGRCYANGEGVDRNRIKGLEFINQAAKLGNKQAIEFKG